MSITGWSPAPTWIALRTKRLKPCAGLQCRNRRVRGRERCIRRLHLNCFKFRAGVRFCDRDARAGDGRAGWICNRPLTVAAELLGAQAEGNRCPRRSRLASGMHSWCDYLTVLDYNDFARLKAGNENINLAVVHYPVDCSRADTSLHSPARSSTQTGSDRTSKCRCPIRPEGRYRDAIDAYRRAIAIEPSCQALL